MEPEFFIVTMPEDGGWGGIQSQEEMSAFFSRTGQMFSYSAAVLRLFCRTHFLFIEQDLFSGQILAFDSLPLVKKLFFGNSADFFCRAAEQSFCPQDRNLFAGQILAFDNLAP